MYHQTGRLPSQTGQAENVFENEAGWRIGVGVVISSVARCAIGVTEAPRLARFRILRALSHHTSVLHTLLWQSRSVFHRNVYSIIPSASIGMSCMNGRRVLHCKARGESCACGLQPADDLVEEGVLRRHVVGHMDSSPTRPVIHSSAPWKFVSSCPR